MRLAALLALAALAACTRPSQDLAAPTSLDLAEAADRTAAAGTALVHLDVRLDDVVVATGEAGFDTAVRARWITYDLRHLPGAGDAVVGFVVRGDDAWVRIPEAGGRPWHHIAGVGVDPPLPGPEHLIDLVRRADADARVVGEEGPGTLHVRSRVMLPDGLVPGSLASDAPKPIDAWIDGDGRLRRIRAHPASPVGTLELTVDLSRFGEPVQVPVPPREDVTALR